MLAALIAGGFQTAHAGDEEQVISVTPSLFDASKPLTLGLVPAPGAETFTVFAPSVGQNAYNHGAVAIAFKGRLYVQWQTSARDEDAPDTHLVYAISDNPARWPAPRILAAARDGATVTSGGWYTDGATLVAFLNVWPLRDDGGRGGHAEYVTSTDGEHWSAPLRVTGQDGRPVDGVVEQDMRALPGGRIVGAFHLAPGLVATPFYTDDPLGTRGWVAGRMTNLPHQGEVSRELEPSWFLRPDGILVMLFRDQDSSFRTLVSESHDNAESWSQPRLADFPDSRSKQSAGTLPDGTIFRVNNPTGNRTRFPLVLSLSKDGRTFDRAMLLRSGGPDLQALRFEGRYKRAGYSYPKSVLSGDWLYVAYATNKEDIQLTRVPWRALVPAP
ncbi:MAG: hypothetical protein EP335_04505 [Alphaproteobacteria bacterium]|nr:MAG: hypothetical protein EP335_04505 [Alphaproteobacteria bacterium]